MPDIWDPQNATPTEAETLTGAELVRIVQAGQARTTTIDDIASTFVPVNSFSGLMNAIDSARVSGNPTTIIWDGAISVSETIVVDESNILLQGTGGDQFHDVGVAGAGARSRLIWTGPAGGTMMKFASPVGAAAQKKYGGGVRGIYFDAASTADIGLQVLSWNAATIQNLHFNNPRVAGLDMGVVATLGEARDPQYNHISQISSRHFETPGGIGGLLRLRGDATANTSLNIFEQLDCQFSNGTAYLFQNSDGNLLTRVRAARAAGTGNAVIFEGSNAAAGETARGNVITHLSANAPTICRGTASFTHPSLGNMVLLLDVENGTPVPTVEAGSSVVWTDTTGLGAFQNFIGGAFGESAAAAIAAKAARSSESLYLVNGSENHVRLANLDGTIAYGVSHAGGWLRFSRLAGTGGFRWTSTAVSDYADDAAAATAGVPVGGMYRTASVLKMRVA